MATGLVVEEDIDAMATSGGVMERFGYHDPGSCWHAVFASPFSEPGTVCKFSCPNEIVPVRFRKLMQLKEALWLCFSLGLAGNIGRLNPSHLQGDRGSLLYMATPVNIPKFDSSAGLIALSLAEAYQVSPHNILAERERVHVASLIAKSFGGLTEISAKAADAVAAFNGLQEFLNEGKLYFFEGSPTSSQDQIVSSIQPSEPHSPSSDQIFMDSKINSLFASS